MSFGAVQSAISSMKNNRNLISKRKKLEKILVGDDNNSQPIVFEQKSTPEKLRILRIRLQNERKQRLKKTIVIFSLFMFLLLSVVVYFF